MQSEAYVRVLAGPVGSSKSVSCVMELMRLCCGQAPNAKGIRKTRVLIVRNTSDQLNQTTRRTIFDWLPPGEAGTWHATMRTYTVEAKLDDGTRVLSEWVMVPMDSPDDVRRALSMEATFLWGNEARELNEVVVDGLLGRLNRYPSMREGGPTRSCAIFDTNMPDVDTWWFDKMENPPENWRIFKQPPAIISLQSYTEKFGADATVIQLSNDDRVVIDPELPMEDSHEGKWLLNPDADNLRNLSRHYYKELVPGKAEDWLRVYLRGEYGRSLSGLPVYDKSFVPEFHIAKDKLKYSRNEAYPLMLGMDFGRTPSVVVGQRDVRGRLLLLGEVTAFDMGVEKFIATKLTPYLTTRFPGCVFVIAPDPAGFDKQQQNEYTLVDALKSAGYKCVKPPTNNPEYRITAVERLLNQQMDGRGMILIDELECPMLVKGFKYGYRYKLKKNAELEDRPDKNEFSHVHDALQYLCCVVDMNVRGVMLGRNTKKEIKPVRYAYS